MSYEYNNNPAAVDALNPADTNLTAVLFSKRDPLANAAARRLARDLVAAGSTAIVVGDAGVASATGIPTSATHSAPEWLTELIAEHFVSALATDSVSADTP